MSEITQILAKIEHGDAQAAGRLLPLVYKELRQLATARLAHEKAGHTLQPTALVHEAFLRLVGSDVPQDWNGRGHFYAAAATAMRRILVEHARRKQRVKHGGGRNRIDMDAIESVVPDPRHDLVALDSALRKLATIDPQAARLVELRQFGGLSLKDVAKELQISPRTADRVWAFARAWLHRELIGTEANPES